MSRVAHHLCVLFLFGAVSLLWMFFVAGATFLRDGPAWRWWVPMSWTAFFAVPGILLVIFVSGVVRDLRVASRHVDGRCRSCGYDLRASPDRCPECGTPAAK
jgi:hypothetical protein